MRDRIPTQVLDNGAIRYAVYDEQGAFLRYEWIKPADEPTDEGTPLNKASLLQDATAALLGLPEADPTVDDAFKHIGKSTDEQRTLYTWHSKLMGFGNGVQSSIKIYYNSGSGNYQPGYARYTKDPNDITYDISTGEWTMSNYTEIDIYGTNSSPVSTLEKSYFQIASLRQNGVNTYPATALYYAEDGLIRYDQSGEDDTDILLQSTTNHLYKVVRADTSRPDVFSYDADAYPNAYPTTGTLTLAGEIVYALASAHTKPKIPVMFTGSYTGTGEFGAQNPNTLTFERQPKIVIIASSDELSTSGDPTIIIMAYPSKSGFSSYTIKNVRVEWSGNTVSWWSTSSDGGFGPNIQGNVNGRLYRWYAIC